MLHMISTRCVVLDFHKIAPCPLGRTCWRQFARGEEIVNISNFTIQCDHYYHNNQVSQIGRRQKDQYEIKTNGFCLFAVVFLFVCLFVCFFCLGQK